jgi:glycosyltransferase involved in cell wall biosynthesis
VYKGLPAVSTSIGAEGIDVENGKHILIADDSKTFANHVNLLLEDPNLSESLALNARNLAQNKYTYEELFGSMLKEINLSQEIQP